MRSVFASALCAAAAISSAHSTAQAAAIVYGADATKTSSVLHGANRELTQIGFMTSSDLWTGANFLRWDDGRLTNNKGSYGWMDAIPRDVNSSNGVSGNPDRADGAAPFLGEAGKTGTLREVFGPFGGGYKNMSYLIDGEDRAAWTLDLLLAPGQTISADANDRTIELSLIERGGNSDLRIRGIRDDGTLTDAIMMLRSQTGRTGWTLDSLEIGGPQNVVGVGISLDRSWTNLKGFRLEAADGMNGPDLIAVGTIAPTPLPTPGTAALMGLAALAAGRRRRA
jgi:MYXO-CTERM domain-containing protein